MGELFGSSIMKDIEETEKAHKLATKVTKVFATVSLRQGRILEDVRVERTAIAFAPSTVSFH